MLTTKTRTDDLYAGARPVSELVPWLMRLTEGVAVNKDGALMASLTIEGSDPEGRERRTLDQEASTLERALLAITHPQLSLWWTIERRQDAGYPETRFTNPASAALDAAYGHDYNEHPHYLSRHTVTLVLADEPKSGRFMDAVGRHAAQGAGFLPSFVAASREAFSTSHRFGADGAQLIARLTILEDIVNRFLAALPDVNARRLTGPPFWGWLSGLLSPADPPQDIIPPDDSSWYLDTRLGTNSLTVYGDHLQFDGATTRHAGGIGVKMWPTETYPGCFDALLGVDAEITASIAMRLMDITEAKNFIAKIRQNNLNAQKGMFTHLKEAMTEEKSDKIDTSKLTAANEADDAMAEIATIPLAAWVNFSVIVYAPTEKSLEGKVLEVIKAMQRAGLVCLRERLHLLSAWAGTLPGQWAEPVRWVFVQGGNLANIAPIRTITAGERVNGHLTKQRRQPSPALCVFDCTRTKSPYYFNWHQEDLGHGFVVGPSRSGKSILCNLLISQWQKYDPCQVFIFDKDASCKIPVILHGGDHLDIAQGLTLNPLAGLSTPEDWTWLAHWLEYLITARGYALTADDDKSIAHALDSVRTIAPSMRRLLTVAGMLPKHLAEQLGPWTGDGPWARFFDHAEDTFALSNLVCVEMGSLMQYGPAARAFLDYAFFRLKKSLDGRPTLIYVEEAWFLLEDEQFASMVNDWLRTFAKKNAILILTTQSLEEIVTSKAFTAIIDNIQTRVYLPNPNVRAHGNLYRDRMGLNDAQIAAIQTGVRKREYYIVTPTVSRMVDMRLSAATLAWLRSDSHAQKRFEYHRRSGHANWQSDYIEEMSRDTGAEQDDQ
ncbi:MAG: VirB4 family type IV secretion/conjugal transfer ATPase [Acidiferrobacter sp.]